MSERLSGPAQAEANAAATIAANEAEMEAEGLAMDAQSERDAAQDITDAYALNRQIDKGAMMADKIDSIEARRTSPEVQAMNEAADIEIFGSRGRTQGYVGEDGKPLTAPIEGVVDKIRGANRGEEIRQNRRYGTKPAEREAVAQDYESRQGERDERAKGYVENIEELQAEGFELSQAKLIMDLSEEIAAKQQTLFSKLMEHGTEGKNLSDSEVAALRNESIDRVVTRTVKDGNDLGMLKRIIKQEGLFDRGEYEKFRFKRGKEENGERKEFAFYREQSVNDYKDRKDNADRRDMLTALQNRAILKQRVAEAEAEGRGDEEPEPTTAVIPPVTDPSPKGLRARARHIMARAGVAMKLGGAQMAEYFGDKEKGKKRKIVAGVAGVIAVGAAAYLKTKGFPGGGSHGSEAALHPSLKPHHHEVMQHAHQAVQGANAAPTSTAGTAGEHAQHGMHSSTTAAEAHHHLPKGTELKPGQNPWTVSEHRLRALGNAHPNPAQIEAYDKAMAHVNPGEYTYGDDSSKYMSVGTKLKFPR